MKIHIMIGSFVGIISMLVLAFALAPYSGLAAGATSQEQGSAWKRWQLTGSSLNAVDAISATDAWTAGSDGTLAHWNGATWTAYDNTKLGPLVFQSVDMLSSSQAWATASGGRILRYDGTTWVDEARNNGTTTLFDVSLTSPSDGWAVGSNATFAHYNGTDWQVVAPGGVLTTTMYGVDMVSSTQGWAVGGASDNSGILGKVARWDGTSWQVVYTGNRILYAVDMLNSTYGWAVGQGGTLLRGNGTSWDTFPSPSGAVTVTGVSVVSTTDVWVVGSTNGWTNNVWHWNGTSWTPVTTPNGAPLEDIVMLSAGDGWIVGQRGTVYRYNGSAWVLSNTHFTTNGFYGLDFLAPNDGWAVGVLNATTPPAYGLQHWNGTDWEIYQPPFFNTTMYDVGMVASNAVWAVGTSGYVFKWNGSAWSRDTSPADAHLYALSMLSATNGWAVGSSGRIVHYDGTAWTNYTSNTTTNLWSIDMVNENEGWAGGTLGLMLHYQNGTWTPLSPNPASFTIEGIHMLNANEGWAVGYNGTILHYLNGTWTSQASPTTQNLLNVHMVSSNEGWAVGATPSGSVGTLLHYQNGTWSLVLNPTGRNLRDIYVFASGEGWAVSESPGAKLYMNVAVITPTPAATNTVPSATSTATAIVTASNTSVPSTNTATATSTNTAIVTTATGTSTTIVPTATAPTTHTPTTLASATGTATTVATATACTITFTDVDESNVFYTFIRCLACRGIISGYSDGTFRPFNDITRGQIAKIVSNSAGFDEDPGSQIYEDVPEGSPFYDWINRLSMRGHIGGYPCGLLPEEPCIEPDNLPYFRPSNSATRGQLAKIVSNAAGLTKTPTGQFYTDVPEGHPFYVWIMRLTDEGVMSGYECGGEGEPCDEENRPYFRPYNNVTRGQASKIVANTFFPGCQTPQRP